MSESINEAAERLRSQIEEEQNEKLKIALFGQPGAGKSSLINRIIGVGEKDKKANVGAATDITTEAEIFEHGELLLVDLPGYGTSKFPENQYFDKFTPEQYDLFLCVFSGKFHQADTNFFKFLKQKGRICLFIRNKSDDIWDEHKEEIDLQNEIREDVKKQVESSEHVFFVSCKNQTGLKELMTGIEQALAPTKREKYYRYTKAYSKDHLDKKKEACMKIVYQHAGLAAANGLNPVIGLNVGADIALMLSLFKKIREAYGLSETQLKNLGPALLPLGKKVVDAATKEGLLLLLKRFSTTKFVQYIPLVGQAISSTAGFAMTFSAGKSYLDDCHALAEEILNKEMNKED